MNICVYCASAQGLAPGLYAQAEAFGRTLAGRGHALVYGGYDYGLMGAVARGVSGGGGEITAVIPAIFRNPALVSPYAVRELYVETLRERKGLMEERADAFAVLPGGVGTFDEFFETPSPMPPRLLDQPFAVLDLGGCCAPLRSLLDAAAADGFLPEKSRAAVRFFAEGGALLDYLERPE